ncbi:transporter substrate-binding domain-containing protein [Nitrincola sp.]|uniref:transporter substrate-binding domain-containing protein n=1 Tax=Nitrincola sp. TaxID=1926584 RepID=UPI003A94CD56
MLKKLLAACAALTITASSLATADTLDEVVNRGTLRCAVVLDFPPIGFWNENNEPAGFDVEYCKDLAASLNVEVELIPATWSERLPLIVTNRADVVIGSTSDSLERAQTVGFTIPYAVFVSQAIIHKDSGIETFEDLRGKAVAAGLGTVQEQWYEAYKEEWGSDWKYQGYQSENEVFLAVQQGKVAAGMTGNIVAGPISQQYSNIELGPILPFTADYVSMAAPRKDISWLNYLNLFIHQQVRTGRYQALWEEFVGSEAPDLTIPGVYY